MTETAKTNRERALEMAAKAQADVSNRGTYGATMAAAEALLAIHFDLARIADALEAHPHSVPIPRLDTSEVRT